MTPNGMPLSGVNNPTPMQPSPGGPSPGAVPSPGQAGPSPQGSAQQPAAIDPQQIADLAQALTPDNFKTLLQVFGAVMLDAYQAIQQAGKRGQPQPGAGGGMPPQPGGPAPMPPKGGMMGKPQSNPAQPAL